MSDRKKVEDAYNRAKEEYESLGVDTDEALRRLDKVELSLHCWQADDVAGFERADSTLEGGGIQVTGNYPGRAKTIAQLRQDIEKVMSLVPGKQRLNLHAIYGDFGGEKVDRDEIEVKHFQSWIDWAKRLGIGIDFNPTCFSHPYADDGFTLSSKNETKRKFWIEHVKRTRRIAAEIGKQLGSASVNNIWIPDGSKDIPVDRNSHRTLLKESLDEIFSENYPREHLIDSLEGKLFGLGVEAMTVGSHEFYLGYAVKNKKIICIDTGHYHPTEQPADKITAVLQFLDGLMLHISRGIHWDSDHVAILNDEVELIALEIVRADALDRVHIGLDYFDASMNRIGAYVVGGRAVQLALLIALLEPTDELRKLEGAGKNFERLALLDILKTKPFGAVYDYYCLLKDVPVGEDYISAIGEYETETLSKRHA
jgi:L-rhamnose isomerase